MKKEKQTTEVAVIENPKLTELAQKSGIELTKAEAHVSAFHPAFAELSELSRPLATLDKENPDQEKVKAFFVQFTALQFPELQSDACKAMAVRVNEALAIVKQVIIQDSKTLL